MDGDVALRDAINALNADPDGDLVELDAVRFAIPGTPTVTLGADLPVTSNAMLIDGTTEPGVTIDGHGFEVFVQTAPGLRHAYTEVLPHVTGDVIVTMSPDGNCPPEAIGALLATIADGYDLVGRALPAAVR